MTKDSPITQGIPRNLETGSDVPVIQEMTKVLGALCQEQSVKDQI